MIFTNGARNMRRILLASTFALVSTAALANSPAPPATPTTGPTYNHPVANGGAGGVGGAGGAGGLAASSAPAATACSNARSIG